MYICIYVYMYIYVYIYICILHTTTPTHNIHMMLYLYTFVVMHMRICTQYFICGYIYIYTHLCCMYMQTHIISPVVPQKTTRNHSLNHWKLGPWRCMASCFFLLRQFEDVLVYLKSIKCLGRSQGWSLLDDGETWPICSLNGGL
jgi:hypothetical protein